MEAVKKSEKEIEELIAMIVFDGCIFITQKKATQISKNIIKLLKEL